MRRALGSDLRDGSCGRADRAGGGGAAGPGADLGDRAPGLTLRAAAEPLRYLVAALVAAKDSGRFGHEPTVSGRSDTSASPRTACIGELRVTAGQPHFDWPGGGRSGRAGPSRTSR